VGRRRFLDPISDRQFEKESRPDLIEASQKKQKKGNSARCRALRDGDGLPQSTIRSFVSLYGPAKQDTYVKSRRKASFFGSWYIQVFSRRDKRKEEVRLCWLITTSFGKSKFSFLSEIKGIITWCVVSRPARREKNKKKIGSVHCSAFASL
jgi:hypothetical protein